jgi:SAM-dependent methyltransferase
MIESGAPLMRPAPEHNEASMYDDFSSDYDRFVNWDSRLAVELPWIQQQLQALRPLNGGVLSVLDAACGTGMHTIALAQRGYAAAGADLSARMVEQARRNAAKAGEQARFEAAGFGALAQTFGEGAFEAVLCLGNSLPHALSAAELRAALADFAACLRPGGLLIVQNRNFDAAMAKRERWMEPQAHQEKSGEWIFVRFYDFDADGLITFNILTLKREGANGWHQQVMATRLRPLLEAEMTAALVAAGFVNIASYGNMNGAPFDAGTSGNLVTTAQRMGG